MYTKCYVNNLKAFNTGNLISSKIAIVNKDKPKLVKTENGYKVISRNKKRVLLKRTTNK